MVRGVAVLILLASCVPPAPPAPHPSDCVDDSNCPSAQFFFCNTITSRCEPTCRAHSECNARPPEFSLPQCEQGLGCHCDNGRCVVRLCSADSDCPAGLVCRDGACVDPPRASIVNGCVVTPDFKLLPPGERARFQVLAWDAQKKPVTIPAGASWTLPGGVTATGNEVEVVAPAASTFTVRAAFGEASCVAWGRVLPSPGRGELVAVVFDERTGRPIPGANVVLSTRDGAVLQQAESELTGVVHLRQTGAEFSVTAFHADFSYLTIANAAAATSQLALALRRNPFDRYGGFKGTFANVPRTSNVHFARVGWALGSELTHVDLSDPPRPWVETPIVIGSAINRRDLVPAGSFLGFGDQQLKNEVWALGANGTCLDPVGRPDEASITAGACGTGATWSLGADLSLGDFPWDVSSEDQFTVLNRLSGFSSFSSSVLRDVPLTLRPTPGAATGAYDITDRSQFTTVTPEFSQLPLAFELTAQLPALPRYHGRHATRAFVVGGAFAPGRGFVPLGLGTGTNTSRDELVDRREPLQEGQVSVRLAPTHHGLEGAPYALISEASTVEQGDPLDGKAFSAIVSRFPGNKLHFGLLDLSRDAFPPVPEGGRFDWRTRTFRLSAPPAGVSVLRVSFSDGFPTSWDVLVDPASPGFTLPAVPGTLRDRLFTNGERSRWSVQAQRLEGVDTFGRYLQTAEPVLTGFSWEEVRPIRLVLESPPVVSAGADVTLSVEGFVLGTGRDDEGVVGVTFTGGTNCPRRVVNRPFGYFTLPFGCTGNAVTIRAELMEKDGTTPLFPPVAWSITVAIR